MTVSAKSIQLVETINNAPIVLNYDSTRSVAESYATIRTMKRRQLDHRPTAAIPALLALGLLAIALLPRTIGLTDFLTTDEAYHWIDRSARFAAAIAEGRWADIILTGHPGVTTMWLGALGGVLEQAAGSAAQAGTPPVIMHLAWLRLPGAILHALVVPSAYLLLRRLIDPLAALIAAALWASAPYLIAHGRLLHLDALLTDFVTMSLLLLLVARQPGRLARLPLLASGACAGLALLTKGPALILLPFAGLSMLFLVNTPGHNYRPRMMIRRLVPVLYDYALWLSCALLVVLLLWPALWVAPERALARYVGEIIANGGRPNGDGQFFLGRAVGDPGALFYLVADLFRTTPAMLIGLLLYGGFVLVRLRRGHDEWTTHAPVLIILMAFILFWTLVMSIGPKKFDRYTLPTWPALLVLAGIGWAGLLRRLDRLVAPRTWPRALILALMIAAELAQLAWYQPYYLSYYNPLLGGGAVAQRLFLIGWGEGMDQVGAYLRSRPDLRYGPVLSALGPTLQPFVPVDVRDVDDYGSLPANYAVVYLESIQRAANPALYEQLQTTVPLRRITIHGIDYALIYQLPRPYTRPIGARFGDALLLRGVTVEQSTSQIILTPAWDVRAHPSGEYRVFVHLLDSQGTRVTQIDVAPGGGDAPPTTAWEPGQQIAVPLPLDLPAGLPPGEYRLVLGVYNVTDNLRLPLLDVTPADPALAGGDALLVDTLQIK